MTISNAYELAILNAVLRGGASVSGTTFVKLHVGDPGEVGDASPAGELRRMAIVFAAAANGVCTSSADVVWPNMANNETITHVSLWTTNGIAGGVGVAVWSGPLTVAKVVFAGDTFTLTAGQVTVTLD